RTVASKDAVEVHVSDRGPGVPPDDRQRIFERFVRLSSTSGGSQVRGSGIGLALVKHIAESHGGNAWVMSSTDPNQGPTGSTFSFSIPAARPGASANRLALAGRVKRP